MPKVQDKQKKKDSMESPSLALGEGGEGGRGVVNDEEREFLLRSITSNSIVST